MLRAASYPAHRVVEPVQPAARNTETNPASAGHRLADTVVDSHPGRKSAVGRLVIRSPFRYTMRDNVSLEEVVLPQGKSTNRR
jgi:hypothetical protein